MAAEISLKLQLHNKLFVTYKNSFNSNLYISRQYSCSDVVGMTNLIVISQYTAICKNITAVLLENGGQSTMHRVSPGFLATQI